MRSYRSATVVLCACIMAASRALGSGWNDYRFDLPSGYCVVRCNADDVHIWRHDGAGMKSVTNRPTVGPLFEIATDPRFIFAKNWGEPRPGGKRSDPFPVFWTIICRDQDTVHGPCSQAEFEQKLLELGVTQPIPWMPLRQAFKQACRDGRADPSQLDVALFGQVLFLAFAWVFYTPVFMLIAVPIAFVVRRIKGWKFLSGFYLAWLGTGALSFGCMAALSIFDWIDMRFL